MILQTFILPGEICQERDVYYHASGNIWQEPIEPVLILEPNSSVTSNTYMNLMDISAWKKYTEIIRLNLCLELSGQGVVEIWNSIGDREVLHGECVYQTNRQRIKIKLDDIEAGKTYFQVKAKSKTAFYKAYYECEELPKHVLLSLVICTYKREQQLKQNIKKLLQSEFWKEGSEFYHKLFVRVVDNASVLTLPQNENLKLYHNPNTGGSGGFTRGIVETQNEHGQYGATHIVLMDDDVEFEMETLYRIYALLSYIKPEYKDEVIAGRMFRQDDKKIQYTASEIWNGGNIRHLGGNLDVSKWENLKEINEQRGEYSGWWLAVFPYEFTMGNLPLPFFLHCDDVEYGLRHGGKPIVLNGIQVWHETYEYRQSPVIAYYDYRNSLIVNAMYGYLGSKEDIFREWKEKLDQYHNANDQIHKYLIISAMYYFVKNKGCLKKSGKISKMNLFLEEKVKLLKIICPIYWRYTEKYLKRMDMKNEIKE